MTTSAAPSSWLEWTNVGKCPVCGGGKGWCGWTGNVVNCHTVASDRPNASGDGWIHFIGGHSAHHRLDGVRTFNIDLRGPREDIASINATYQLAIHPAMLESLATQLGVTSDSLQRLGVGSAFDANFRKGAGPSLFDPGDAMRSCGLRTWSFPMRNGAGNVCGVRLRRDDTEKWSVAGGKEGIFIPSGLADGPLLLPEGPTDCAALLTLGFDAIGRPNCSGGAKYVTRYVVSHAIREVVVVADNDKSNAGWLGAKSLASVLRAYCRSVKIIAPPAGVKDSRAWLNVGATTGDIQSAIDTAPTLNIRIADNIGAEECAHA